MPTHVLKVDEENSRLRLDIFLAKNLTDIPSRSFVKKLFDAGSITVNHRNVKSHYKVTFGDEVVVTWSDEEFSQKYIEAEKIDLDIFYEDGQILVINKPAGMLVHPAQGKNSGTLVNALLYYGKNLSEINLTSGPGIVHRLDQETSGLLLIAKDNKTHVQLAQQFERRLVKKRYVALVEGSIEFDEGVIDAPLGRHPRHRNKKAVQFHELAKAATTFYRVLKRHKYSTMVALLPQTGRTHQLRVHMAYLGHPILGDEKYGRKYSFPRLALHAQSIGFFHPQTSAYLEFWSTLPEEFHIKEETQAKGPNKN